MRSAHANATINATRQETQITTKQRRNCAHLLICYCTFMCDIECFGMRQQFFLEMTMNVTTTSQMAFLHIQTFITSH